ncbi:MAG: M23 family metallopeptidase [Hyphomonadaceae bacterium]
MWGFVRGFLLGAALIGAGWVVGSIYPAPASVTGPLVRQSSTIAQRLGIEDVSLESLSQLMSAEDIGRLREEASALAARAGEVIVVEHDPDRLAEQIETLPETAAVAPPVTPTPGVFETSLSLCPSMTVSNAPPSDAQRRVANYRNIIDVNGVALAANPTLGACLSSAFGPRGRGQHKGVDYHARDGGPILAAGAGTVVEAVYRDDYGNMLVIDHGNGVYTRYAHLSSFSRGIVAGARVEAGQQIGLMGNTASYPIPIHLHYEVLTGDYNTPARSFGLTPRSPFAS